MVFVGGLIIGIFIFAEGYSLWDQIYTANYLGIPKISESLGLKDGVMAMIIVLMAFAMFWIGEWAEKKFPREEY